MKTNEFKKRIKELGLKVEDMGDEIHVHSNKDTIATVTENKIYNMGTNWNDFQRLNNELKEKLFLILTEYASTPVEEREEIKRYKLRFELQHADIATNNQDYLNYCFVTGNYFISNGEDDEVFKTVFTEKEIKELDNKSNILATFIREEVIDA